MTVLFGRFRDIAGDWSQGRVTVISTVTRAAIHASQEVITEERHVLPLVDGSFTTPELDPGPVVLELQAGGVFHRWEGINLPEDGEHDFASLLDLTTEYAPPVVGQAQAAAMEAGRAANRAEAASSTAVERAQHVDDVIDGAIQIVRGEFVAESEAAVTARGEAEQFATDAGASASAASGAESAAAASATAAAGSASSAAQDATVADQAASDAAGHATSTAADAEQTADDRIAAGQYALAAATSATDAASSATDAETARAGAEQAVTDAAANIVTEVSGFVDQAGSSATAAAGHRDAARGHRDAAEAAAAAAGEIATGNLPGATETTRGLVTLGGDLGGTADAPTVPALSLTAAGASVMLEPQAEGWGNATAPAASTHTGWEFDGAWLTPPQWLDTAIVTVDWCGGTEAVLRGRRPDQSVATLATIPAGTPESHRKVTVLVNLHAHPDLAVGGTWVPADLESGCTVSMLVQPLPPHEHTTSDVVGLQDALDSKVDTTDGRLSDARTPTQHLHQMDDINGLQGALGQRATVGAVEAVETSVTTLGQKVDARPAMWLWDGLGSWQPPDHATVNDTVINLDTGEIHSIQEVPE